MINNNKILIFLLALIVWGCEEDLEIQPEQSLTPELAFANELATNASLNGAYSRMQSLNVYGSMPQIINDYQADNVNFIGSFPTLQQIVFSAVLSDNATIDVIYRDHYRAILAANAVIANTPGVQDDGFTEAEKNQVVAEAKFVRALTYLSLVNLFGQPYSLDDGASLGMSLLTEPGALDGDFTLVDRSTVAQTYELIVQDLMEAQSALPDGGSRTRATAGAAQALLSRVYLYTEDYQQAADLALQVIDNSNYELAADYSFYDQETPETIFDIDMSPIDNSRTGSGGWAEFYNPAADGGRGDCPYSQDLLDAYEDGDLRLSELSKEDPNDSTQIYTTKFPQVVTHADNAPVLRITEMYLNRAEALAKLNGVNQESIDLINALRQRAGLSDLQTSDFGSQEELVDAILHERRLELAFEGHRRIDMLRNGIPIVLSQATLMPGDEQAVMPIPQREIDLGSGLPQNPGY